jgi:hypothetical protein
MFISVNTTLEAMAVSIKMFVLGVRRPDMPPAAFHDHWRHPHGTWGRRMPTLQGYVQSHQLETHLLGPTQSRYECVAEMWLEESDLDDRLGNDPVLQEYLIPDAPRFVIPEQSVSLAVHEHVVSTAAMVPVDFGAAGAGDELWSPENCPVAIKLLHFIGLDEDPDWVYADHNGMARRLGALRHVHCVPLRAATDVPFLGVHELWWPTLTAFHAGAAAEPRALAHFAARGRASITLLAQAERFPVMHTLP